MNFDIRCLFDKQERKEILVFHLEFSTDQKHQTPSTNKRAQSDAVSMDEIKNNCHEI